MEKVSKKSYRMFFSGKICDFFGMSVRNADSESTNIWNKPNERKQS